MGIFSTPASNVSNIARIIIGTSDNTTAPPFGLNMSPNIENIQHSATPDLRKSNKLDVAIDGKFPNYLVVPPIFTEIICDKLSDSSRRDIYTRCRMNQTKIFIRYISTD